MELGLLRLLGPLLLGAAAAWWIDRSTRLRGLDPPRFASDAGRFPGSSWVRRILAMTVLGLVLWLSVFAPLGAIGLEFETPDRLPLPQLFQIHVFLVAAVVLWFGLGYVTGSPILETWQRQLGMRWKGALRELALGSAFGVCAWLCVLVTLMLVGSLVYFLAGEGSLPESPPEMVGLIAGLPIVVRFALSLSAGVVEELFFRGFLQPRVGIGLSSAAFVLAHASYGQPLMLVGLTLLSVIFALLVKWRQSIWAAIAAHAVFDVVQLLFVIPNLLDFLQPGTLEAAPIL